MRPVSTPRKIPPLRALTGGNRPSYDRLQRCIPIADRDPKVNGGVMRRSRVLALLVAALVAAISATLAATASGRSHKTINVAVFLASAANTYWTAELQGAQDIAKKYGNVKLTVFDAQFTTTKQINQLRD